MDKSLSNGLGRTIRLKTEGRLHVYVQIKDQHGREIGSILLNSRELQLLFNMVNEATGIIE